MRTKVLYFVLATLLLTGYSHTAKAQFWKKLFNKEEKKPVKRKPQPKPQPDVKEHKDIKASPKKQETDLAETVKKDRYRVDVLVPLYLDELVKDGKPTFKGKVPEKATTGLEFYEGIKLAADTLGIFGYNIDVYVHDIGTKDPESFIAGKKLESADMLIGLVNYKDIRPLADYASKKHVNFISALSPADADVTGNPYFILMQPTFETHCERLKEALDKKYPRVKPVVLYRNSVKMDETAYRNFEDVKAEHKILVNEMPAVEQLSTVLDSNETNVILMPILDVSYSEKLLYQLNEWFPGYKIEVYGMPSWRGMNSLKKPDAYPSIGITYTDAFYFDASTSAGKAVANAYKKVSGNGNTPEMIFRGYETMYWYAYMLSKYGTIFNDKFKDNGSAPFTRFDIKPKKDKNGDTRYYENKHIYLVRFQSASFMVERG